MAPSQSKPMLTNQQPAMVEKPGPVTAAEPVYRMSYARPEISDETLRRNGLVRFRLKHLDLITDLTPDLYEPLLPLPDAMLSTWEEFFGKLPPARDGSDYRVTGYLMRDRELFLAAGLVKENTLLSYHGRQIGAEFWLNDQSWDYYRRHLLLHEATHAFMRHLPGEAIDLPLWYLEGMAEMLSTHRVAEDGTVEFNVMPVDRSRFLGLERIAIVQRDVKANGVRPLSAITRFGAEDFTKVESYAWCWALCRFLDSHPKYRARFRRIAGELITVPFRQNMATLYAPDMKQLQTEWLLFAANVEHGFDFERAQVEFRAGRPIVGTAEATVQSDRGWQSTEILVEAGRQYLVTASGQFTLADQPKPWISEANGVSIRYSRGRPLGQLQASVLRETSGDAPPGSSMLREVAMGNKAVFEATDSGTLYLRINDAWGELADNRGTLSVTIEPIPDAVDQAAGR
ncbi:MAG: hypothetical protein HQ518_28065 [Rhodopirellula sp.]|nr:hypothetical protein [Rhodopirellula sp.]